jgi:transcriptional regulator with XRE-family HTH domain
MDKVFFDVENFYAALDSQRASKQYTWKKVADESGVSASTLTRMAQQKRPDVDSLAKLASWSGLNVDDYVVGTKKVSPKISPLTQVTTYLRADPKLSNKNAEAMEALIMAVYKTFTAA